uniref:Uncharacterized protein n=1 Tax=Cohnella candidum TaxID=2674991 RepID=A0A3G3K1F6_9BACL|nr:hypothetical protein EAV92_18005 [Cohnella candidum]
MLASLAVGYFMVYRLPPRLPKSVAALVMLWSVATPLCMDHSIGSPPIDVYDTNINPALTFTDFLTWCMYPIFGYVFIYLYDLWKIGGLGIPLYVLAWAILGACFEKLSVVFRVFQYKDWSTYDSFLIYVIVQLLTVVFFRILMKVFKRAGKV